MKTILGVLIGVGALFSAGCGDGLQSTSQLRLPPGNVDYGKAAFVALNCTACHTVSGVADLPKPTVAPENVVALGGDVARVRTVGELLTAIVHPSFNLSEKMNRSSEGKVTKTPMRDVNDRMTVRQMIDLVTFLQPQYKQIPPAPDFYYVF